MVKKILNWTANGFFRSLGKFLFFFLITCLIAILVGNGSLKLTDLLGIETVNAQVIDTYRVWDTGNSSRYYFSCDNGSNNTTAIKEIYFSFQYNATVPSGVNRIVIPLSYYMTIMNNAGTNQYNAILNSALQVQLRTNDGEWAVCGVGDTQLTCSVNEGYTYTGVHFRFVPAFSGMFDCLRVSLNQIINFEYSNDINDIYNNISNVQTSINEVETAITNQSEVIQSGFDNMTDTLTDTDTDTDSSDMVDYLNDLSLTNEGIVSTFVNLPISIIESLVLNNSNNSICTTFRGQNLCLPSGVIVWGRNNPNCNLTTNLACANSTTVNAFKNFFSLVVGGWWSYLMLKSVVSTIDNVVDPFKDRIEVSKL